MPLQLDIHQNQFLDEIWQMGWREGSEEGLDRGTLQGWCNSLIRILEVRFGPAPDTGALLRIEQGALSDVQRWSGLAVSAPNPRDIFD